MTEKEDFKQSVSIAGIEVPIIDLGLDENGWTIYNRYIPQIPTIDHESKVISIFVEEWRVPPSGKIYNELYTVKAYRLTDNKDLNDLKYTQWIQTIASLLIPSIANTIKRFPVEWENNMLINGTPLMFYWTFGDNSINPNETIQSLISDEFLNEFTKAGINSVAEAVKFSVSDLQGKGISQASIDELIAILESWNIKIYYPQLTV